MLETAESPNSTNGGTAIGGTRSSPSLSLDRIVMPFAYVAAAMVFLLGLQHVIGLRINSCQVTHQGFTCSIDKLEQEIKEKNDTAIEVFDEINKKIAALARRIDATGSPSAAASTGSAATGAAVGSSSPNVVSDALASYLRPIGGSAQPGAAKAGAIFLGNNQDETSVANLETAAGTRLKFADIRPGQDYKVTANLTLRASMPPNSPEYYNAVTSSGVLPKGTVVRLIGARPFETISRGTLQQVWAEVQVVR